MAGVVGGRISMLTPKAEGMHSAGICSVASASPEASEVIDKRLAKITVDPVNVHVPMTGKLTPSPPCAAGVNPSGARMRGDN